MSEKKSFLDRHEIGGIIAHYCAIPPSQPPCIAYKIAEYISPTITTPFIAVYAGVCERAGDITQVDAT